MEYVDLPLLKEYVNEQTTSADALLTQCLKTACRQIESQTGRRFYQDELATSRTYSVAGRLVHEADADLLIVDDIASAVGLLVETGNGTSWTAVTDYDLEPENALALGRPATYLRRSSWGGYGRTRVRVTARWGWPAVPEEVVQATLMQAARLWKRKDSVDGMRGSEEFGFLRVARMDSDVQALLRPFIIKSVG
ncbi:phage gp6-like head-tail connector protein [Micromonospora sp. WMMD718]|uniref:phage gp6-like head-tail connector protein n=1 Tax=Micromonospora sp. WMMD718 TaxID=3016098 RepID=UPI00241689DD|nr:phage gp6-like head-tail connector protein [Micromonospora sp. WMMD718]MDG4750621.1 phage gp6-like head-tail connector protein [Micromonospora sp. WMMD718]